MSAHAISAPINIDAAAFSHARLFATPAVARHGEDDDVRRALILADLAAPEQMQAVTAEDYVARPHARSTPWEIALLVFTVIYFAWQFGRAYGAGVL